MEEITDEFSLDQQEDQQEIIQQDSENGLSDPIQIACPLSTAPCPTATINPFSGPPRIPSFQSTPTPNLGPFISSNPSSFSIFIPPSFSTTSSPNFVPTPTPAPTQDVPEPASFSSDLINLSLAPSIFINSSPSSCVTVEEFLAQESRFELFYEMIELAGFMQFFNQTELEGTLFIAENSAFEQVFEQFGLTRKEFFDDPFLPRIAAYSILDFRLKTEDMQNFQLLNTVLPDGDIYVRKGENDEIFLVPIAVEFTGQIIDRDREACNIIVHELSTLMVPAFNEDGSLVTHPGPNATLPIFQNQNQNQQQEEYYEYYYDQKQNLDVEQEEAAELSNNDGLLVEYEEDIVGEPQTLDNLLYGQFKTNN